VSEEPLPDGEGVADGAVDEVVLEPGSSALLPMEKLAQAIRVLFA